jgi:uncharacterized membrane protein
MQGIQRRIVYITLYEGIAIVAASAGLALLTGAGLGHSGALAVAASVIAVIWNLIFNSLFERWEARQAVRGRSLKRRIAHAIGFEGGLIGLLVPMFAWGLGISLWQALVMDLGLVVFFLVYTFVFNWAFDRAFGLPARPAAGKIATPSKERCSGGARDPLVRDPPSGLEGAFSQNLPGRPGCNDAHLTCLPLPR